MVTQGRNCLFMEVIAIEMMGNCPIELFDYSCWTELVFCGSHECGGEGYMSVEGKVT